MNTLFLEIFGPFVLVGTIYSLVVIFRKHQAPEELEGEGLEEDNSLTEERKDGSNSTEGSR